MLPMSGVGEPKAGAPGDPGAAAGCLPPGAPVAPAEPDGAAAPGRAGVPAWGAAAFGAAADPVFARSLPALVWPVVPVVVDGCWAIAAIAASAHRQSMTAAGRYGRRRPREPAMIRGMRA